jgi:type II secretory pathway predicted ATPase ExeA
MLLQLNSWLIERYRNHGLCILVIDEAQNMSWELLEEIRLLTNLETSSDKLLQIVLSGQPELEEMLRNPCVRQLRQRVSVWCKTLPLTDEQSQAYIAERLRIAGTSETLFSPEALHLVHLNSGGIPRLINLICEHALICAYVEQIKFVPARIIESVCLELNLDPRPLMASTLAQTEFPEGASQPSISSIITRNSDLPDILRDRAL